MSVLVHDFSIVHAARSIDKKTNSFIYIKVKIRNNAFIGAKSKILSGSTIGDNCIVRDSRLQTPRHKFNLYR